MSGRKSSGGFVHNMLLSSLVVASILVVGISALSEKNVQGLSIAESTTEAREQIGVIRDALFACRVTWPAGNNGLGYRVNYPATPGGAEWGYVTDLVCPGSSANLWLSLGHSLRAPARGVAPWRYKHAADGIYIRLDSTTSDGEGVVAQVAQRFPVAEKTVTKTSVIIRLMN